MAVLQIAAQGLLWAILTGTSYYIWWPSALVGLVPLGMLAAGEDHRGWRRGVMGVSAVLYFTGIAYWFAFYSLSALVALAVLQSFSILLVTVGWRESHRRGVPWVIALPVCWVAGEYLRSLGPFGFPNGALALALQRQLWAIQVADLGGIFLVSFAIAMVSGALLDLWQARAAGGVAGRWRGLGSGIVALGAWLAIGCYGRYRLAESQHTLQPGPVVAAVQPDVPYAPEAGEGYDPARLFERLFELSQAAARQSPPPALIMWPESGLLAPLNPEFWQADPGQIERTVEAALRAQPSADRGQVRGWLQDKMRQGRDFSARVQALADESNAGLIVGAPMRLPGSSRQGDPWRNYNAAFLFRPHLPPVMQQKVHLFPVSERIPFFGTWAEAPFRWIATMTSSRPEFEIEPGAAFLPLSFTDPAAAYPFILPICGEIDLASTSGVFVPHDAPRLIVNISDDGSFRRSAMLQVRQSMLRYRAIESRSGLVRSANTGVSCFVRPTGEIYGAVQNARGESWTGRGFPERPVIAEVLRRKASASGATAAEIAPLVAEIRRLRAEAGVEGYSVQRVDLDSRRTIYSRIGDLFAQLCTGMLGIALLAAAQRAWTQRKAKVSDITH